MGLSDRARVACAAAPALALVACLIAIAGCGSSTDSTSLASHEEPDGPLKNVGTLKISGSDGRTIAVNFHLGPLLYRNEGAPPQAVLKACGVDSPEALRGIVFSKGKMTVTMVKGRSITDYRLSPAGLVTGDTWHGMSAIYAGGTWRCDVGPETVLHRNKPQTFSFWILSQVLIEGERRVPKTTLSSWRFGQFPVLPDSAFRAVGPGATVCLVADHEREHLMLYGRKPFRISGITGPPVSCRPIDR